MKLTLTMAFLTTTLGIISLQGCGPKDTYLKTQYVQAGPCFVWGSIEKGRLKAVYFCHAPNLKIPGVFCNRQENHNGKHHSHFGANCLSVWR